jgi:hypothetical protein
MKPLVLAASIVLAVGTISSQWFDTSSHGAVIHEGVLYSEVCGIGVGVDHAIDELDAFGEAQAKGGVPPLLPWTCDRTVNALQVGKIRSAAGLLFWLIPLLCVAAGLVETTLLVLVLSGRRPRGIIVTAGLGLAAAAVYAGFALLDGTAIWSFSVGIYSYVAGGILAIVAARRGAFEARTQNRPTGASL